MNEAGARVQAAFERVARTRMAGMPFVNPALRVELVGLREWNGEHIGVLVTPWSINVLLLPGRGTWTPLPAGAERFVDFPAGRYRFVAAIDDVIGEYHACSLFSPALEFQDQEAARLTASLALGALLDPDRRAEAPQAAITRREFLRGSRDGHVDRR